MHPFLGWAVLLLTGAICYVSSGTVLAETQRFPFGKRLTLLEIPVPDAGTGNLVSIRISDDGIGTGRFWCNGEGGMKFSVSGDRLVMVHGFTMSTQVGCSEQVNKADERLRSVLRNARWHVVGSELKLSNGVDELTFLID